MLTKLLRIATAALINFLIMPEISAQRYLTDIDSSFFIKDTVRPIIRRFENIIISGYMQPQFQVAESDSCSFPYVIGRWPFVQSRRLAIYCLIQAFIKTT